MSNHNTNVLVDEKVAISLFLDSLLREPETETETVTPAESAVADVTTLKVATPVTTEVKVDAPPLIEQDIKIQEIEQVEQAELQQQQDRLPEQAEWANKPFQVLLFTVAGLKLAIPLVELSGVVEWTDKVTEMPGHADFYMGILQHLEHKIPIIDTAKMVFPVNKQAELVGDKARQRVKHIVLIGNHQWGLACDKIGEVITLESKGVRWRSADNSRTWLAGTVIEHMCALLNAEGFATMLKSDA